MTEAAREVQKEFDRQLGVWKQAKWTSHAEETMAGALDWVIIHMRDLTLRQRAEARALMKYFGYLD